MIQKIQRNANPLNVIIRIKPQDYIIDYTDTTVKICNLKNKITTYSFDKVFGPSVTTRKIYEFIKNYLCKKVCYTIKENSITNIEKKEFKDINKQHIYKNVENNNNIDKGNDKVYDSNNLGFNNKTSLLYENHKKITILAYGQTGSGKTYTMTGTDKSPGIIPFFLQEIIQSDQVKVSFIEIYNERIIDLSDCKEKDLREVDGKVIVQNIIKKSFSTITEFNDLIAKALNNRKTGETKLNKNSSRSHLMVQIDVNDSLIINLCDFAGSENNSRTENQGKRIEESSNINKSLFVFNKVVNAIINKEKRIPYRDSKLTRLLQDSVGGSGECFLIGTIIDCLDSYGELARTLNFASKSKQIVNKVEEFKYNKSLEKKNSESNYKRLCFKPVRSQTVNLNKENMNSPVSPISSNFENLKEVKVINDNCSNKKYKHRDSPLLTDKKIVEMTPITKQKSYDFFLARAIEYENSGNGKNALEIYKTMKKFANSKFINEKIAKHQEMLKKKKIKIPVTKALEILNSGIFLEIKQINNIGDKRAQAIVNFIVKGNYFKKIEDLKMIFSDKVVKHIKEHIE